MNKRYKVMSVSLIIVFGGIIGFNLFKTFMIKRFFANYKPPAVTVASAQVKKVDWKPTINTVGNFMAANGVDISAQASGNVTKIDFQSGQFVNKDAELIAIDDSVDQAILKFNQSDLALKKLNHKRQRDLFKRGAVSISTVDESQATLEQAQARVDQTQAQINQKHIRAPFSGQLGIRQINLGQYINPGQTTIVSLQSLDPLYLEFYIPEQWFKKINIHQNIHFAIEGFPNYLFTAQITAINSKIDSNTHNILVQGTLANCPAVALRDTMHSNLIKIDPKLSNNKQLISCDTQLNQRNNIQQFAFIPGMFADIQIEQPKQGQALLVPSTAISYSLYGNSVYVIEATPDKDNPGTKNLIAKRVFVSTGEQQGNFTIIKKGLKAGQLIVSAGEIKLQNDTPVVINNNVKLHEISKPDSIGQ